ncbi:MAG: L-histidine N(alpha)-methyltransferase [Parvibaculaceae bacterium]|nr:L-histidine N(alpha)-methyltransferase [Parvibaculaceae bacterium]
MPKSIDAKNNRPQAADTLAFFQDLEPPANDFLQDAVNGLSATPKNMSPKYFYDQKGSQLFDAICDTQEYYVTRTEIDLLKSLIPTLNKLAGPNAAIVEYGSGASVKVRTLLEGLDHVSSYLAIDISRTHLINACRVLADDYPDIAIGAICADFTAPIVLPPMSREKGNVVGFLPGSTIGNFAPKEAGAFLARAAKMLGKDGSLLMGVDLKKDPAILNAAYNDKQGITAAFNLNLLTRMRGELGAKLDQNTFCHKAFYNDDQGRIEMHLQSETDQTVHLDGQEFTFSAGETIHTENSYKYGLEEFAALAETAGFRAKHSWTDPEGLFSLHWLEVHTE